jgi:tetratricopeptide (TPR) repeat protein
LTDFFKHHWRGRFVSPKEDIKGIRKSTTLPSLLFLFLGITVGVNFRMYAGESKDISLQDSNASTAKYEQKKQTTAVSDLIEEVQSIYKINQGSKAFKEDKTAEAESYFLQALKSKKLSSIALNNLGVSYLKQGLPDKAIAAFTESLQVAQSAQEKFIGNFNLGVVHHLGKHKEAAIQYYRKALDIDSSSKELKTNIELLLNDQQQNGKDGGEGDSKDNDKDNKNDQNKDKNKDKEQDGKDNKDNSDKKDDSDGKDSQDKNKQNKPDEENKKYKSNKPQPKPFESKDLSPSDVNKILGELKQQEQKIRADYNKREVKEKPKDKDW